VQRAPVVQEGVLSREAIGALIESVLALRPDFILSINASGMDEQGLLAGLFADLRVPHALWFVDDPRTILLQRDCYGTDYAVALTWEHAYEGYLRERGFTEAHTVPLGVDDSLFNAPPAEDTQHPPTFIGNSMADLATREWAWIAHHSQVAAALNEAFAAGRVTRQNFGLGIQTLLGDTNIEAWDEHQRRHAEMYCFIESTRRERFGLVAALAPYGLQVAGDDAWKALVPGALPYINYAEHMPAYYRACSVNLNITSIQMPTAVNQRVLDCPAAGGFLLTDAQSQLADLFEVDSEVAVYNTFDEARDKMLHYATHPAERRAITDRARARVLGEHTYGHRLRHIVSLLQQRYAGD
jgi:spore maturation protein CgeB